MTATAATNKRWARPPKVTETAIETNHSARNTAHSANSISQPPEYFSEPINIFFRAVREPLSGLACRAAHVASASHR